MKVCNFTNTQYGMLVKYSSHWYRESGQKVGRIKIGMIVDRTFYTDRNNSQLAVCWPVVQWEGNVSSLPVHPANIVPYRQENMKKIGWIEISD